MNNINNQKRKIAFIVEHCNMKGLYCFERVITLSKLLNEHEIFIFAKSDNLDAFTLFEEASISPTVFESFKQLKNSFRNLQIDLTIIDGKDVSAEQLQYLQPFTKNIVTFDQYEDCHSLTQCNIFAIYNEQNEVNRHNYLIGSYGFAVPENIKKLERESIRPLATPHILVYFEDGDPENLTYRTLRHLTQLQIPLKITIILDEQYDHAREDLQIMVLSRRQTTIQKGREAFYNLLPQANILIGNGNYTPYKAASFGIPYIALAQNDYELHNFILKETNGFIHLGLGRKIKQSALQNAVMELLLHEERGSRAIRKQKMLQLHQNNELLQALLHDLAVGEYRVTL